MKVLSSFLPVKKKKKWYTPGCKNEMVSPRKIVAMPLDGPLDTVTTGWLDGGETSACFCDFHLIYFFFFLSVYMLRGHKDFSSANVGGRKN